MEIFDNAKKKAEKNSIAVPFAANEAVVYGKRGCRLRQMRLSFVANEDVI